MASEKGILGHIRVEAAAAQARGGGLVTPERPVIAAIHIQAPQQRVFASFVEPDKLTLWLAQWAELERPAGRSALDIQGTPIRGRSLEINPDHRLRWSWGHAGSERLPPD